MRNRFGKRLTCRLNRMLYGRPLKAHCCENLADVEANTEVHITCNHDHKTMERGLYTGVPIRVMRNEAGEPNIVVAVGDSRYVLDRRIARNIKVR